MVKMQTAMEERILFLIKLRRYVMLVGRGKSLGSRVVLSL